jgi:hypothetical protein
VNVPPRRRARRRRERTLLRAAAAVVVLASAFAAGIALGEALHDNPQPGGTQTLVRTLRPLPVAPAPVTVTVRKGRG